MNYEEFLLDLLEKDERYIILTAENRAAMRNLPNKIKDRFIDVGIAEQTMVGIAAGLALRGRIPIVHALSTFLTMRAFEFIRTDVGIGNLPVKLMGAVPGFLSEANGPTHQAIEDISLMRGIPNVNVFSPSDEQDMILGLPQIFASPNPYYIRYTNLKPAVEHQKNFEIGKAEIISEGNDIVFLVHGMLLKQAMEASKILADFGKSAGVVNMRSLKPVDENILINACKKYKLIATLEDHLITGGLYSILSETMIRNRISCRVIPIALENRWFKPALLDDVLHYEKFDSGSIAEKINLEFKKIHAEPQYSI
ncbi:MAG TPA: transketolase C-terminal domain-containing protein [Ignavibacteriaceae bacterium]|nr:transketolase C-terminal domain-containing protein [Ignavibacteriaceae bacterium]